MESLRRDVAYAVRLLVRAPGFTFVVILTLALGIGANTAIFSIVNGVVLRPLPYPDADRLAVVWEDRVDEPGAIMYAAPPNFADWRRESRTFGAMGAFAPGSRFLVRETGTVPVPAARISAGLLETLGVAPALGRSLRPEDVGDAGAVLIGHGLWQREFGADPEIVGRTIRLGDGPRTVAGVMPEGFEFPPTLELDGGSAPRGTQLWVPFEATPEAMNRGARFLTVVGRLADGIELRTAASELETLAARLAREHPEANAGWTTRVVPLERVLVGDVRTPLLVLLAAVGALLLIACVNVANLMLARAADRQREYALRAALGAGRGDLIRHSLVESQLLALAGGAGGLLLAFLALDGLLALAPGDIPRLGDVTIDRAVLAYTLGAAVLTGLLFGLVPAIRPFTRSVSEILKGGGRTGSGRDSRLRQGLVVAEVALSVVLLIGAGLLARSFLQLRGVDTGLRPEQALTLRVTLPESSHPDAGRVEAGFRELERRIAALPQVTAAGFTADVPLATDFQGTVLRFRDLPAPPDERWLAHFTLVTPGYFEAAGIPLASGRRFDAGDDGTAAPVAVVNEAIVHTYLDGRSPLGRVLEFDRPRTVVGVVGDVRLEQLDADPTPAFYLPHAQVEGYRSLSLVARYRGEAGPALQAVRREIRGVDPGLPLFDVRTMREVVDARLTRPRFSAAMLGAFSGLALALAGVGLFGVISHLVSRRTREIGLRIALGATPAAARRMVVAQGGRLVAVGVAAGLAISLAGGRLLESLLFRTTATDPVVLVGAPAFLALVGLLASWLPARRAAAIEPMEALRYE